MPAKRKTTAPKNFNPIGERMVRLVAELQADAPDMGAMTRRNMLSTRVFAESLPGGHNAKQPALHLSWGRIVRLCDQLIAKRIQSRTLATLRSTLLSNLLSRDLSTDGINPDLGATP